MNHFLSTTIELWPVERLIPYDRNARTHSDEQIEQMARSIREFGFTNPILVTIKENDMKGLIALVTVGRVPGIDQATFTEHAQAAKAGCPVSRALAGVPEITLEATLL